MRDRNTCYLIRSTWDDFSFKASFELVYLDEDKEEHSFGTVKIIKEDQERGQTPMPDSPFTNLDESYCSLGNGQDYYEEMMNLPEAVRIDILTSLRDCVFNPQVFERFDDQPGMGASLLRDVSVDSVSVLFSSILRGDAVLTPYHFRYLLNGSDETVIDVEVTPHSLPPTNIHVLIGRNGVGKTRIVSGIMDSIAKPAEPSAISLSGTLEFGSNVDEWEITSSDSERFTNLIVVVFSAFDNFRPVRNQADRDSIPCFYIGLKKEDNETFKKPEELTEEFIDSFLRIIKSNRRRRWIEMVKILCSDPIFNDYKLYELNFDDPDVGFMTNMFDNLSSGHRIILLAITRLVQIMDEKTLVLIDEPENHLHPPLLSSFVKALSELARQRNAVALIATHSPVVLQEVPQTCVTKINRVGNTYALSRPDFETYGENIDILTRDVFMLELEDSGFYSALKKEIERTGYNYDVLLRTYGGRIGSQAKAIALAIIAARRANDAQY